MIKTTKLAGLLIFEKEGIMYAATRTKQENLNADAIVVLSPKHPVTRLILRSLHEINHRGVQYTVARSRLFTGYHKQAKLSGRSRINVSNVD